MNPHRNQFPIFQSTLPNLDRRFFPSGTKTTTTPNTPTNLLGHPISSVKVAPPKIIPPKVTKACALTWFHRVYGSHGIRLIGGYSGQPDPAGLGRKILHVDIRRASPGLAITLGKRDKIASYGDWTFLAANPIGTVHARPHVGWHDVMTEARGIVERDQREREVKREKERVERLKAMGGAVGR